MSEEFIHDSRKEKRDIYFSGEKALEFGIVDEVLEAKMTEIELKNIAHKRDAATDDK